MLLFCTMVQSLFVILLSLAIFILSGCSKPVVRTPVDNAIPPPQTVIKSPSVIPKKSDRKERPYSVNGKWYFPVSSVVEYREKGICSWYGSDFHGKQTSSGEIYNMFGYTAAHRILPFNTQIRVKNPANDRVILVRINDRGPFLKDRILDLSFTGAKELGLIGPGTALIEVEALGILEEVEENGQKSTRLVQQIDFQQGDFSVQIGAFKDRQNALRLQEKLQSEYPQAEVSETIRLGETFFRVRLPHCTRLEEALRLQKQLEGKGFTQAVVVAQ
ncbi:MAG: septal ring lytic transglycosylase RlpA family lipoprotein [Desulfobacca sp.]|nr:septal ring lytic transglycosylase RlpA family lipoprotein [Desulfobacca sp.]